MTARNSNPWLYIPKPLSVRSLRLICLPHAGGSATFFRPWMPAFLPDIELCAVQLPGHETRFKEPLETNLSRAVSLLLDSVQHLLEEPCALFGHSMGAMLAYELARQMRQRVLPSPVHLFVSGRKAPSAAKPKHEMWRLPEPEFIRIVTARYNGMPNAILNDPDLMRLFMPVLRADIAMVETYTCEEQESLDIPLSVISGLDDPTATFEELAGWRNFTRSDFRLEMLPGGHFYFQEKREALIASMLRDLSKWVRPIQGSELGF